MGTLGLFPRTRARLLATLLLQPERACYLHELARHLGTQPSSLQAELASLADQGILVRRRDGNRVYYQANPDCPYLEELQGLLAKTVGIVDVLREALQPLADRIQVAFVYGSIAKGTADASSDIDLLVVGEVTLKELAKVLPHAAVKLGRPVNPTVYPPDEFAEKVARGHRFLRTVLDEDKLFVIGSSHAVGGAAPAEAR